MTAPKSVDVAGFLREELVSASPDLLRTMVKTFAEALMSAEADTVCGAAYGERSDERTNQRNGYRHRDWDTRAGTIELAIPKLRQGSYFPEWLLQHRRRAEQALVSVVATAYLLGVNQAGGEARGATRHRRVVQESSVGDGRASGRAGRGVSQPASRRRPVYVPRPGRTGGEGPRTWPDRQRPYL